MGRSADGKQRAALTSVDLPNGGPRCLRTVPVEIATLGTPTMCRRVPPVTNHHQQQVRLAGSTWGWVCVLKRSQWVRRCREVGEGLLGRVVASFVPSGACLCVRQECFLRAFGRERARGQIKICVPCGSANSSGWSTGEMRADQYQLFFEGGPGSARTIDGMGRTKEVMTGESNVCNSCYMAFHNHMTRTCGVLVSHIEVGGSVL